MCNFDITAVELADPAALGAEQQSFTHGDQPWLFCAVCSVPNLHREAFQTSAPLDLVTRQYQQGALIVSPCRFYIVFALMANDIHWTRAMGVEFHLDSTTVQRVFNF